MIVMRQGRDNMEWYWILIIGFVVGWVCNSLNRWFSPLPFIGP